MPAPTPVRACAHHRAEFEQRRRAAGRVDPRGVAQRRRELLSDARDHPHDLVDRGRRHSLHEPTGRTLARKRTRASHTLNKPQPRKTTVDDR
jgi:hypothetical protein